MAQARRVQKALHASPEGGTEDDVRTPLTDAEGSLFPETENNWYWCMAQARRVQKALCASPEGSTEDNVCTPLTRVLCLGLPCGRRFSVNGPLRSRPLPQVIDVAGARFRPSPSATVRGLVDPDCRSTTVSRDRRYPMGGVPHGRPVTMQSSSVSARLHWCPVSPLARSHCPWPSAAVFCRVSPCGDHASAPPCCLPPEHGLL
jgi:hypothetical protein